MVARTSLMRFKRSNFPLDRIGRALAAAYVLEGSARREGGRVRISATLVACATRPNAGRRPSTASSPAFSACRATSPRLSPDHWRWRCFRRSSPLRPVKPVDPAGYEAYLEGRSHAIRLTPLDLDTAEKDFDQALAKDPAFAFAYAGLSLVWSGRQQMQFVPPAEAGPRLRAAASRAIELDDTLPEAHLSSPTPTPGPIGIGPEQSRSFAVLSSCGRTTPKRGRSTHITCTS